MKQAVYFEELGNDVLECRLCPHHCKIEPGRSGLCLSRKNLRGMLYSSNYGELTSIAVDPIEKKPLYHFYPGSEILSVGSWGCNLLCQFCQNWEISKSRPRIIRRVDPEQLVEISQENNSFGIAFTYNEPIVSFEFLLDTSRAASKEGIISLMVTNGVIEEEPLELLVQSVRAMNIDLKGWSDDFYRSHIGVEKKYVQRTIEKSFAAGVHVEITTLVIPGLNDSKDDMDQQARWIASLSEDIPLHLTRYFPNYKMEVPPTPPETIFSLCEVARQHLNYVYAGNIGASEAGDTRCPECGELLVKRRGYSVTVERLDSEGRCSNCGRNAAIIV